MSEHTDGFPAWTNDCAQYLMDCLGGLEYGDILRTLYQGGWLRNPNECSAPSPAPSPSAAHAELLAEADKWLGMGRADRPYPTVQRASDDLIMRLCAALRAASPGHAEVQQGYPADDLPCEAHGATICEPCAYDRGFAAGRTPLPWTTEHATLLNDAGSMCIAEHAPPWWQAVEMLTRLAAALRAASPSPGAVEAAYRGGWRAGETAGVCREPGRERSDINDDWANSAARRATEGAMKEQELRAAAECALCDQKIGNSRVPLFYRVTVERYGVNLAAVQRQQGLGMMLGSPALAMVMGADEDLATRVMEPVTVTVCEACSTDYETCVAELAERAVSHG